MCKNTFPNNRFQKDRRVRRKQDFQKILRYRKKAYSRNTIISYTKNNFGYARLGISVSKKFGNAVKRNKFKRTIREIFRKSDLMKNASLDVLISMKRGRDAQSYEVLANELETTWKQMES